MKREGEEERKAKSEKREERKAKSEKREEREDEERTMCKKRNKRKKLGDMENVYTFSTPKCSKILSTKVNTHYYNSLSIGSRPVWVIYFNRWWNFGSMAHIFCQ